MAAGSIAQHQKAFTAFYDSLVQIHPDVFSPTGRCRIGSTYRVPGAGGLDAQTFYMRHILQLVLPNNDVVEDLVALARAAYRGTEPDLEVVWRIQTSEGLFAALYEATEAASGLTARIGDWPEGTDLFANVLTNVDCALQIAGIYDHAAERSKHTKSSGSGTMDQSAIDALFG